MMIQRQYLSKTVMFSSYIELKMIGCLELVEMEKQGFSPLHLCANLLTLWKSTLVSLTILLEPIFVVFI